MDEYYRAIRSLPSWLSRPLAELPVELAEQVHEIRLRVGCPVQMTISGVLCTSARVPALRQIVLTQLQMDEIFLTLCGGSVHTHQAEVAQGYVTLPNGCRAGLGGRFFLHPTQGAVLQQLHSVNLRIARRKWITLPEELRGLLEQRLTGVLLIGEPDSGKTTLLRSIAQALAAQDKTVCVIDERREICPGSTVPYEQKTMAVDEISGLPKAMAVQMALRTLSPQFILLDELGGTEEVRALEQGMFSGAAIIATLHASSWEEAFCRLRGVAGCRAASWPGSSGSGCRGADIMTALRLVGAFFLVVCGWCAGDAVCIRTQEHLEALRQTIALLEEIEQEITFRRADLNMLSKKLQREHKLFCSAKMIQTAIPPQSFSPQEAACFAECFSALGHTEAEQACSRLAFYQERFRSFLQQQEKAAQSRLVLAPKLGILLGLTAAILLF